MKWFVKEEPVIFGGILAGVGVFLGIRYGAHVNGATQIFPGVSVATFVSALSRWVGPNAPQDVQGIANDVASLKQQVKQIGPLPKNGSGVMGIAEWTKNQLSGHLSEALAIIEAAKTDALDLIHQKPAISADPPTTAPNTGGVTIHEPETVSTTLPEPTVAEPTDAMADLKAALG